MNKFVMYLKDFVDDLSIIIPYDDSISNIFDQTPMNSPRNNSETAYSLYKYKKYINKDDPKVRCAPSIDSLQGSY